MRITKVFYQTSVNVAQYRHKHLGAESTVQEHEDPQAVLLDLAQWVHAQLGIKPKRPAPTPPPLRQNDPLDMTWAHYDSDEP